MGLFDAVNHLLNFTAPAAFVALFTALFARVLLRKARSLPGFWSLAGFCFAASLLVLLAGLVVFGRDGRMATYAAMVLVCATVPWVMARAWRA